MTISRLLHSTPKAALGGLAINLLAIGGIAAAAQPISGVGRSIDGDSLIVGQTEVRLFGIDAPELAQSCTRDGQAWSCGTAAAEQLAALAGGKHVTCYLTGLDRHGRTVARCTAGGVDLNRAMVAMGYALAYRRYSTEYVSAEESAKVSKRGIWSGTFEQPSEIRHAGGDYMIEAPRPERATRGSMPVVSSARSKPQPSGNCRIKGNQSRRGARIYHLPGMPYYEQTVAEEIFCTEAQARAAGYRRSRVDQH